MRVLVVSAPFAELTSAQTGAAMARAWAEVGARLAVVPIAEAGRGFARAWADLTGAEPGGWHGAEVFRGPGGLAVRPAIDNPPEPHDPASSELVGQQLASVLARAEHTGPSPDEVWLEVPEWTWADGGQGFLAALEHVRPILDRVRLHLVTTSQQAALHLTGLRGITAAAGMAAGRHPGEMLEADQRLVDWCAELGDESLGTTPGAGAAGGLGAAVLGRRGDVVTGPAEIARLAGLEDSIAGADLVVTGYDQLDFGSKGGDLLPVVAGLAESVGTPVIALSRTNFISARELRTMGVEQGFALGTRPGERLDEPGITAACRAVARTWSW